MGNDKPITLFLVGVLFFVAYVHLSATKPLTVCAFNVFRFGTKKANDAIIMGVLAKIFTRYDLCLMQEIYDKAGKAIPALLDRINEGRKGGNKYGLALGPRVGTSDKSEEQYAFFYKLNRLSVVANFTFNDGKRGSAFARPPFIVRFKAKNAAVEDFFIVGIHTRPEEAPKEIAHLVHAYEDAVANFGIEEGVIMGDFNAGCTYFRNKDWKCNPLWNDKKKFKWFLNHEDKTQVVDTTVGESPCGYDRIVAGGTLLKDHIKNAGTYRYDEVKGNGINIPDKDSVKRVSDHYPIEFTIN